MRGITLNHLFTVSYIELMTDMPNNLPDRVAFIADLHLGLPGDSPERAESVAAFLRGLSGTVSHLYIVGDLFDFWFEYRRVVPAVAPTVVFELYNLARGGTTITLLAGNHDYWFGHYLRDAVGLHVVRDDVTVSHQGRTIHLHHGDGLYPDDHGYRMLKRFIRHPFIIKMFRWIHPDIAWRIAMLTSKTSRQYLSPPPEKADHAATLFRDIADNRFKDACDAAVYGHTHVPLVEERPSGTLVLLGDWIVHSTYVLLENGKFTLHSALEDINHG
jgi:UDP-2,3-diacylglucosamine hydrolase